MNCPSSLRDRPPYARLRTPCTSPSRLLSCRPPRLRRQQRRLQRDHHVGRLRGGLGREDRHARLLRLDEVLDDRVPLVCVLGHGMIEREGRDERFGERDLLLWESRVLVGNGAWKVV